MRERGEVGEGARERVWGRGRKERRREGREGGRAGEERKGERCESEIDPLDEGGMHWKKLFVTFFCHLKCITTAEDTLYSLNSYAHKLHTICTCQSIHLKLKVICNLSTYHCSVSFSLLTSAITTVITWLNATTIIIGSPLVCVGIL